MWSLAGAVLVVGLVIEPGRSSTTVITRPASQVVTVSLSPTTTAPSRPVPAPTPVPAPPVVPVTTTTVVMEPANWIEPSPVIDHLVLVGDSLAQETAAMIAMLTEPLTSVRSYFGGTAPCDWLDDDMPAGPTSVVVITFSGNSLTPCMSDGQGGFLSHQPLIDRYRADVATLIDMARQKGARVVLVGQPRRAPTTGQDDRADGINAAFQDFAATWNFVTYVDAGASVETPDGQYTDHLPCTSFDQNCQPDGQIRVRGDGVHFCPIVGENPCSIYSSGALRFSLAIAGEVNRLVNPNA